jgi:glutamate racemase
VVVLGCTHYPLLTDEISQVAPWPVTYIDPAPAIARRVADVAEETVLKGPDASVPAHGSVILTAARGASAETLRAYAAMGFPHFEVLEMPADQSVAARP